MNTMKNQKILIIPLFVSFNCSLLFIWTGTKTLSKYSNDPGDWHFIGALIGTLGFISLLIVCLVGFVAVLFPERFKKFYQYTLKRKKNESMEL